MMEDKLKYFENEEILELDDEFEFECLACGKCCYNNHHEIVLTGYDMFRLTKGLKKEVKEIAKYCNFHIGYDTKLPLFILKMVNDGVCSFYENGKCGCHDCKPITCALYPLGRMFKLNEKDKTVDVKYASMIKKSCGGTGKKYTVREFLEKSNILNSEEEVCAHQDLIITLCENDYVKLYKKKFESITSEQRRLILITLCFIMYEIFEEDKSYKEQIMERKKHINKIIEMAGTFDCLSEKKLNRNDLCRCGSNKKYKHCCMKQNN